MAEETILSVSLKDYKQQIADLQAEMLNLEKGTEEYAKVAEEARKKQEKLNEVLSDTKSQGAAAEGSYNALVKQMSELKKAWKATGDEAERNTLGKQILQINDKLKSLDASTGNFQRNVGDYANAFKSAFSELKGGIVSSVPAFQTASTAAKAFNMSLGPIGVIIGAIVLVVQQLVEGFKRNQDAMDSLSKAMIPLKAAFNLIQQAIDLIVQGIAWLCDGIAELWEIIAGGDEANSEFERLAKTNKEILELEKQIREEKRANVTLDAQSRLEIEKQKRIAEDKSKSEAERKAALEEIDRLEESINKRKIEQLQHEYDLIKAQNSLNSTSAEDAQKEAEALAALTDAQAELQRKQTETFKKGQEVAEQSRAKQKAAASEAKAAAEKAAKEEIDRQRQGLANEKEFIELKLSAAKKGSDEYIRLTKEKFNKEEEIAIFEAKQKIKDEEVLAETIANIRSLYSQQRTKKEEEFIAQENYIIQKGLENQRDIYAKGSQDYLQADVTVKQTILENLKQNFDELDVDFQARKIKAQEELANAEQALENYKKKQEEQQMLNERNSLEKGSDEWLQADIEYKKAILDSLEQRIDESDIDFYARRLQAQEAYNSAAKALDDKRVAEAKKATEQEKKDKQQFANSLKTIVNSLTTMWMNQINAQVEAGEITQEEAEKQFNSIKAVKIAIATVETIAAAIAAYDGIVSSTGGWGLAAAIATMVTVIATGFAQIAEISSTSLSTTNTSNTAAGKGASVTNPSVVIPTFDYTPEYTANVTSKSDTDNLTNAVSQANVKAYVVESDLTAASELKYKRETNTTF